MSRSSYHYYRQLDIEASEELERHEEGLRRALDARGTHSYSETELDDFPEPYDPMATLHPDVISKALADEKARLEADSSADDSEEDWLKWYNDRQRHNER